VFAMHDVRVPFSRLPYNIKLCPVPGADTASWWGEFPICIYVPNWCRSPPFPTPPDSQASTANENSPDSSPPNMHKEVDNEDQGLENITYPPPWRWESFFPGGYSQGRMLKFRKPKNMYKAINMFAGVAIMFYGYDQGVMSQVNLNENYQTLMGINPIEGNSRNVAAEGGIVCVYYGGTLIGALVAGALADRCGRIKAVVFGSLWALVGAVLQVPAQDISMMCVARVIAGVGIGAIDCVVPVWSAEMSSHSARGAFLAIEFFMVSLFSSSEIVPEQNG